MSATLDEPFQGGQFSHLPHRPCTTLYHRNGRIGCGTNSRGFDGHVGRLLGIPSDDYDQDYGAAAFVAVVPQHDLTKAVVEQFRSYDTLRGLIVVNATGADDNGSKVNPAPLAPQGIYTPSADLSVAPNYEWNSAYGQSLTILDLYDVPVVYVQDEDLSSYLLKTATEQSVRDYPAIVAEFNYYMGYSDGTSTRITSTDCLSWIDNDGKWRPKCLPLGGNSVWATAGSSLDRDLNTYNSNAKDVIMIAGAMDGSSMFHDLSPSANGAASNILSVLLAARLVGQSLTHADLDALNNKIAFALFQGETFGYIGSRAFLRDAYYPGFTCAENVTVYYEDDVEKAFYERGQNSCLDPLRPTLAFQKLGEISSMITVDQIGMLESSNTLYVHGTDYDSEGNNANDVGEFVGNTLTQLSTDDFTISLSSNANGDYENENGNESPVPPSPLTSLLQMSGGSASGAVLTGYDTNFVNPNYESHLDSDFEQPIDLDAVAAAATTLARAAVALAYDDGSQDYESAANYAKNAIPEQASAEEDEVFASLADCLYFDGNCDFWNKYVDMDRQNEYERSGIEFRKQNSRGSPPSYYVNVYDGRNGQAFVQVGNKQYGSYDGSDFGNHDDDTITLYPTSLEAGIRGMLDDFLGRGSYGDDDPGSCKSSSDCKDQSYCIGGTSSGVSDDYAVCTGGGVCVCSRSHYHTALDEAVVPATNDRTGRFLSKMEDEQYGDEYSFSSSALYTEPYWAADVGVRVYRDAGDFGYWALFVGFVCSFGFASASVYMKTLLVKEKLF